MALKAIATQVPKLTREALKRRGAAFATIVAEWANIVGPALASSTLPEKLGTPPRPPKGVDVPPQAGVLTLRVAGGAAMELQHLAPQLVERINSFTGFKAVERLRFIQGPMPLAAPPPSPPPRPLTAAEKCQLGLAVESLGDADLKAALLRLGEGLKRGRRGKA
ncbi:MAG: DUF721 domain-containing protein [Proteobacteria bacterium]|nr:DUF721 domain-containing protein [Pseudomonadota bacterium]